MTLLDGVDFDRPDRCDRLTVDPRRVLSWGDLPYLVTGEHKVAEWYLDRYLLSAGPSDDSLSTLISWDADSGKLPHLDPSSGMVLLDPPDLDPCCNPVPDPVRRLPFSSEDPWLSIDPNQWIDGAMRHHGDVLAVPATDAPLAPAVPSFLPSRVGLNALDALPGGHLLFSPARVGTVSTPGGLLRLYPGKIYRRDAITGAITVEVDPSAAGIHLGDIDALDRLSDHTFAFSVAATRYVSVGGELLRLYHQNVYRYDPDAETITLYWDAAADGVPDLDALDVLPDGLVVFSTSSSPWAAIGGVVQRLWAGDLYVIDPATKALELVFDGSARGLTGNLDAASLNPANEEFPTCD